MEFKEIVFENQTIIVVKSRTFGGYVFNAWEPSQVGGHHGTITSFGTKGFWGSLSTKHGTGYDHLPPGSPERIKAVNAHFEAMKERSRRAIIQAYPEAKEGLKESRERGNGDIVIWASGDPEFSS